MSEHHPHTAAKPYNSNPFTLAFDALGRLFNTNVGWAVTIIVLGLFGVFWQLLANIASLIPTDSTTTTTTQQATTASSSSATLTSGEVVGVTILVIFVVLFVAAILLAIITIQIFVSGMFAYVALQSEQGRSVGFGEAFHAVAKRFWRLLGAKILADIKIFLWALLLIVPGIVAALKYSVLPYVIMDQPEATKGVRTAHSRTKVVVKGRLIEVLGLSFAAGIIPIVGDVLRISGGAAQYRQLAASYDHKTERPKVHWLNYLVFIIFGGLLFLILGIVALVLVLTQI